MHISSQLISSMLFATDTGCFKRRKSIVKGASREGKKKEKRGGRKGKEKGKEKESRFQGWCIEEVTESKPEMSKLPTILPLNSVETEETLQNPEEHTY